MINTSYSYFDDMEKSFRVNFINSLSGFKSANLIGTLSSDGLPNLCIVSSVVHLGANPPLIAFINRPASVDRHTLENIIDTGVFTINHVNTEIIDASHQTSARYPREESEFDATGLNKVFIDGFKAPYVAESHVQIGLNYVEHHTLLNNTVMVIGEISHVQVPSAAIGKDGLIDIESLGTIAVSGLDTYHQTQRIKRLTYAKPNTLPKEVV